MINTHSAHGDVNHVAAQSPVRKSHLLLLLLLLCFSGNPAVYRQGFIDFLYVGFSVLLAILMILQRRAVITPDLVKIASVYGLIMIIQAVSFSFFPAVTIVGYFVRVFIGFAVVTLVADFPRLYVSAMVLLALMSFLFYIPEQIGHVLGFEWAVLFQPLERLIGTSADRREIFFHTFWRNVSYRNAGMFWEPGAFAGYLNLALVFLAIIRERVSRRAYLYSLIILSVALFTTLSTAGYIVYPVAMFLHCRWKPQERKTVAARILLAGYVVAPILMVACAYGYRELDFMGEKIRGDLDVIRYDTERWHKTRLGAMIFDWEYVKRRPLIGWGIHSTTRYALHPWMEHSEGMGNGMSDFTAKFGLAGMLTFVIALFSGFMSLTHHHVGRSALGVLTILLLLQGEAFLNYPLFLGLMFLGASNSSGLIPEWCRRPYPKAAFSAVGMARVD